ncbi:MAG: hypothetical protein SFT81_01260 [Candidatus Caenarcaniphilales bacterium]|nr:hypothetical protein [Candidatus Caenarcaniphilales bacterium]
MSPDTIQNLTAVALVLLGIGFIVIAILLIVLVVVLVPCLIQIARLLTSVNLIMTTANNEIMPQLVKLSGVVDQANKFVISSQLVTGKLGKSALSWLVGIKAGWDAFFLSRTDKTSSNSGE